MTTFLVCYLVAWATFCLAAAFLAATRVRIPWRETVRFLVTPWKVMVFAPAIVFTTFAGRFTDDETWDVVSGGGMSLLTAATAWWSIGTALKVWRGERPVHQLVVAVAVGLFSSAWFYDGYLLLRDGSYTPRWLGNLMLSPIVYVCAGFVANLEYREGRVAFAFTRPDWPAPAASGKTWPLLLASIPLAAVAAYILIASVGWHH